jgi:hypothetical protein
VVAEDAAEPEVAAVPATAAAATEDAALETAETTEETPLPPVDREGLLYTLKRLPSPQIVLVLPLHFIVHSESDLKVLEASKVVPQ